MAEFVSTPLIAFYRGTGPNAAGRRIAEIWAFNHRRLEAVHDYIQWLFPLPDASRFNPDAPRLTAAEARAFAGDPDLAARLLRSLDVMLAFYGLARRERTIGPGPDFAARVPVWLTPLNHNHLRLPRMLLSLRYLGREPEAAALFACLSDIAKADGREAISPRTLQFWSDARRAPLL